MITFLKLGYYGNLGNTMFQVAATVGTALKKNYEVKLPKCETYYNPNYNSNNVSPYDGFEMNVPVITEEEKGQIKHSYREAGFEYQDSINSIKDNTDLLGYFQTEKYFIHAKQDIKNIFKFKNRVQLKSKDLFTKFNIIPDETVSIHVRRNDYVYKQQYHPLQSIEYFEEAYKKTKLKNVLVFSDDMLWCRQNIKGDNIHFSDSRDPFVDMCAMSFCRNNIIVNSTFGWWGAWLNECPDKIVVAPKLWFGTAYNNVVTTDVIPSQWIII